MQTPTRHMLLKVGLCQPDSYWPITSGNKAGSLPFPLSCKPQVGRSRKGDMLYSKEQGKKISRSFRHFSKKFFEDFYAQAEKAGRFPWPLQAAAALGRILNGATEGEWPPQPTDRPGISTEVFDSVAPRFPEEAYHHSWYGNAPRRGFHASLGAGAAECRAALAASLRRQEQSSKAHSAARSSRSFGFAVTLGNSGKAGRRLGVSIELSRGTLKRQYEQGSARACARTLQSETV